MALVSSTYPDLVVAAENQGLALDQVFADVSTDPGTGEITAVDPLVTLTDDGEIPMTDDGTVITNSYMEALAEGAPEGEIIEGMSGASDGGMLSFLPFF